MSEAADVTYFTSSEKVVANSGLPPETLIEVGQDHRLADEESLAKMLEACERLVDESSNTTGGNRR